MLTLGRYARGCGEPPSPVPACLPARPPNRRYLALSRAFSRVTCGTRACVRACARECLRACVLVCEDVNGVCMLCAHRALKAIPGADIKFVSGGGEISGDSRSWLKARTPAAESACPVHVPACACMYLHLPACARPVPSPLSGPILSPVPGGGRCMAGVRTPAYRTAPPPTPLASRTRTSA